ncbi:MAG: DinB family protein [Lacisediminihabitans sp.]
MAITPDAKDWTWVLERPCAECGFDASVFDATDVAVLIRKNVAAWPAVLRRADVAVRPDESTWSPLEYAAHVRDVYRLFLVRLELMLTQDDPTYANWDQDETAITGRYNEQDPEAVSRELVDAGSALADAFDLVSGEQWRRPGRRGDGAKFTVESFAKYLAHDPQHHLWDVRR